jgi:hypothetical protein
MTKKHFSVALLAVLGSAVAPFTDASTVVTGDNTDAYASASAANVSNNSGDQVTRVLTSSYTNSAQATANDLISNSSATATTSIGFDITATDISGSLSGSGNISCNSPSNPCTVSGYGSLNLFFTVDTPTTYAWATSLAPGSVAFYINGGPTSVAPNSSGTLAPGSYDITGSAGDTQFGYSLASGSKALVFPTYSFDLTLGGSPISISTSPPPVPLPAAVWLMLSSLSGLGVFIRRHALTPPTATHM